MRQLVGDHLDPDKFDVVGEQVGRLRRQRRRDLAVEMGFAAAFVGKGVKDGEGARPQADGEPGGGPGLFDDERAGVAEKSGDLLLLAGLGFETDIKRERCSGGFLFSPRSMTLRPDCARTMAAAGPPNRSTSGFIRPFEARAAPWDSWGWERTSFRN